MGTQEEHYRACRDPAGYVDGESALRQLVKKIVADVHPLQIVLFGSAARQQQGQWSDLDVLVVMPDGTPKRQTAQRIYCLLRGLRVPVDILVTTQGDLNHQKDNPGLIYRTILREGRSLHAV